MRARADQFAQGDINNAIKYGLSNYADKYGLTPEDETGEGLDEINYYEVCRKGNLILYEFEDAIIDSVVPEEVVNEIFPEYETDSTKGYLIEENGEFYV